MPPQGRDLTQPHLTWLAGLAGARHSVSGLWLEIRVSLRHLLTRTFGRQKAGGGVLLNRFLSLETPWRIAWAKVLGVGGETSPKLGWAPQHPWCIYCLSFQRLRSPRWGTLWRPQKFQNGSWKHRISLQPQQFSTLLPPSCWTSVGSSPSPGIPWKCPTSQCLCSREAHSLLWPPSLSWCAEWLEGPSPSYKDSLAFAHQTLTKDHRQWPPLRKEHQSLSQMVVSLWVLEIHLLSWKNKELIHWHQHAKPRNCTEATQREGSQTQQQIKEEKKTKDDYYYLTALRLCLYWAEAAPGWGAQEPRGLSWLCWGTWPCSCQALPSSRAACCPGKQPGWNNWFISWGVEPALMFWY